MRRTVETIVGPVSLDCPSCFCMPRRAAFSPVNEAMEPLPQRKQGDMQKAAPCLAVEVPYDTAAKLLQALMALAVSDYTMHQVVDTSTAGVTVRDVKSNGG